MKLEEWVEHHRHEGHQPHPAPTKENPERWECKCDPDAAWTAVWRILTIEQIRQKFARLKKAPHRPALRRLPSPPLVRSRYSYDPRSSGRCTAGLLAFLMISSAVAAAALMSGCAQAAPSESPSYQEGYDGLMSFARKAVAEATSRGYSDSLAIFAGSPQQVARICEGKLEAMMAGNTLAIAAGNAPTLPTGVSSVDYVNGCTAAGNDMLEPGAK